MANDDTNGDAIRLVEYWMRKACGGELPPPEDWGKIAGRKDDRTWEAAVAELEVAATAALKEKTGGWIAAPVWQEGDTAWKEICRTARSRGVVIHAFKAAEKISKGRKWYEAEHATVREPIPAEFFQDDVSFGPLHPYPIYYAARGGIFNAPWLDPVVFINQVRPRGKPGRKPIYDWNLLKNKAMELMDHHGDFTFDDPEWNAQGCLEQEMLRSCGDAAPSESLMREHVAGWVDEWRKLKAGKGL